MGRPPREIWTPAKRNIIREWHNWANKNPQSAERETAFAAFYLHLERNSAELLTFPDANKFVTVREWLAQERLLDL